MTISAGPSLGPSTRAISVRDSRDPPTARAKRRTSLDAGTDRRAELRRRSIQFLKSLATGPSEERNPRPCLIRIEVGSPFDAEAHPEDRLAGRGRRIRTFGPGEAALVEVPD